MTFVNISLLAGTALVALPIVLHLIMRRRPTLIEFPAIRFIQRRHDQNQRRLKLRHLLLLLLRAAAIALLAFALARPSIKLDTVIGSQESPVAAALVFDSAAHMHYRHNNQTRIEAARDTALWLLAQFPEQSEIAVLDARLDSAPAFQTDRGLAKDRIAKLDVSANAQSLPAAIEDAVKLMRQNYLDRKEIYIFTDLSRGSWPEEQAARMQRRIAEVPGLAVYIIDVGVAKPINYGLDEIRLSGDVISNRGKLGIETGLSCIGQAAERVVELHLLDNKKQSQKRDERSYPAQPGESQRVEFRIGGLEPGVHQGFLRIVGQDGLADDDTRYFTVQVKPAWRVLVAAPNPAESYAIFLTEALAPSVYRKRGQAAFDCDIRQLAELDKLPLADYSAVFLLDPTPLKPEIWKKLADFAAQGRGVAVFLGRNAQPVDSFNEPRAQELLPGKLIRQARRPDGELHLSPLAAQHPILAAFRGQAGAVPWNIFPVFRYWELDEIPKGANVVLPYNDGRPAVVERPVGRGRILLMTTPISDRASQNAWNLLPVGEAWPFLILANQMANYMVGGGEQRLNYVAGQTAVLPLDAADQRRQYMLFAPDDLSYPIPADQNRRELTVASTDRVGNYRVKAGSSAADLGFSVNYAPNQTRLDRLTEQELAAVFGPMKYRIAATREQIDRDVSTGRVGRELFSSVILLVAVVLGLEMLIANRFYRE